MRCRNCDQYLLEDETICWQCGHPVAATVDQAPAQVKVKEGWHRPTNEPRVSALAVYTTFTVLIIVSALALSAFLGNLPRLQAGGSGIPRDWERVSDRAHTFTVFLPPNWALLDGGDEEEQPALNRLVAENPVFYSATLPFAELVEDMEVVFLASRETPAESGTSQAFLLIARSSILNQLNPAEIIGLARESDVAVVEANVVDDSNRRRVYLELEMPAVGTTGLLCRQHVMEGNSYSLLAAACTRLDNPLRTTLQEILNTLQRSER